MNTQNNLKFFLLWKIVLIPVFVFVIIHFLKDITQDLLGIPTVLDIFGDAKEDLSSFPESFVWFYHWFMVNTFFLEIYLVFSIPKTWRRKNFSKTDIITFSSIIYLIIAFSTAILLDPRF